MACCGAPCPQYVKSATFTNTSQGEVTLNVTFQKSGNTSYTIAPGASQEVAKSYEDGSASFVDPITGFTATEGGVTNSDGFAQPQFIEVQNYEVGAKGVTAKTG